MNVNKSYKDDLKKLLQEKDINKIEDYFLKLSISKLNGKIINKDNIVGPELVKLIDDIPNIDYYRINNQRVLCEKLDENKCNANPHCSFNNSKCSFALTENLLFEFIKKLSNEIVEIDVKLFNYSYIRAYINGFYWIKHKAYTLDSRNLGFYSSLQNELINLFRSQIIDWLNVPDNIESLTKISNSVKELIKNPILYVDMESNYKITINKYIINLMENPIESNYGLFEIYILNRIHDIPVVIIYNDLPKFLVENKSVKELNNKNENKDLLQPTHICIGVDISHEKKYPNVIEAIYFK